MRVRKIKTKSYALPLPLCGVTLPASSNLAHEHEHEHEAHLHLALPSILHIARSRAPLCSPFKRKKHKAPRIVYELLLLINVLLPTHYGAH